MLRCQGFQEKEVKFGVEQTFQINRLDLGRIEKIRESYFRDAESLIEDLKTLESQPFVQDEPEIEDLKSFYYCSD